MPTRPPGSSRGSSSRATSTSTCTRGARGPDPHRARPSPRRTLRPGSARPRARGAPTRTPRQPSDAAAGLGASLDGSRARPGPVPGPERPRPHRGAGAERVAEVLSRRVQASRSSTRRCSDPSRTTFERARAGQRGGVPALASRQNGWPASSRRSTPRSSARLAPTGPQRHDRGMCRRCCGTTNGALTALDASFGPTKTFAKGDPAGIEQLDPTIGQALPWLAQATALLQPERARRDSCPI